MALIRQLMQFKALLTQKQHSAEQKNNDVLNAEIKEKWQLVLYAYQFSAMEETAARNEFIALTHVYARTLRSRATVELLYDTVHKISRAINVDLTDDYLEEEGATYTASSPSFARSKE